VYKGITGKIALITGASRGIGKAIAMALASEGARIAICAREEENLKLTADEIRVHTHTDILALKANTMKINDIRRFINAAIKKYGRIDILVNNAGGAHVGGIFSTNDEEWEYHIQLKLLGYIRTCREVAQHMKTSGGGKIINIVGVAGREPDPLSMVPGMTNAALLNFTKSLSKELAADKIYVNCVNPATTDTMLSAETFKTLSAITQKSPEELRQRAAQSLNGSLIDPEEIAHAVLFLASDAAKAISGTSITVDAGSLSGLW
jgi:NAD(P)-dependent dehydrogenase (short-subunit alcohol dehydrogenase family)